MYAREVATIVVSDAVTKLEALETVSRVTGAYVEGAGTRDPRVPLADGVWAQIDIPKFGEAPPLAIDIHAGEAGDARTHALALRDLLRAQTGWTVEPAWAWRDA